MPSLEEPLRGSILRGWRNIVAHGYAAVYQDTTAPRGRTGCIAMTPLMGRIHWTGSPASPGAIKWSSAGATTTFAAASTRHPTLRAFFAQAGASSIYDDVALTS